MSRFASLGDIVKYNSLEDISSLDIRSDGGPRGSIMASKRMRHIDEHIACPPSPVLSRIPCISPSGIGSAPTVEKFHSGFLRFQKAYFSENKALYKRLKQGQAPKTCLIGCCDSRVDPALITDCDPGDIFVIRNVANLVAPYEYHAGGGFHGTSSALEYAVKVLNVENIIILGHARCGGVQALMENLATGLEFIGPWMEIAKEAKEKTLRYYKDHPLALQCKACEQASILQSLENLTTYPWINERLKAQTLSLTGWYFNFDSGDLLAYSNESCRFEALTSENIPLVKSNTEQSLPELPSKDTYEPLDQPSLSM